MLYFQFQSISKIDFEEQRPIADDLFELFKDIMNAEYIIFAEAFRRKKPKEEIPKVTYKRASLTASIEEKIQEQWG